MLFIIGYTIHGSSAMTGFIASLYCISLILATITLTYSLNNVIILFNFISIVFILAFSLLVFNFISITLLIIIIYSTLMSILFLVNGILVMYSLSFKYMSLYNDFGLLMNHSLYCFICYIYLYLFESIIYLDSLSTFYLSFPHSFHFVNHCFKGISNLVFDNTLFMFVFLFFIVGMININLLFLVNAIGLIRLDCQSGESSL